MATIATSPWRPGVLRRSRARIGRLQRRTLLLPAFIVSVLAVSGAVGAVTAHAPALGVAGAFAAIAGAVVVWRPQVATLFVVALIYSNAVVVAVRIHGVPESAQYLVALMLLIPLAERALRRREPVAVARSAVFAGLFLVVQIVSTLVSRDPSRAFEGVKISLLEGVAVFLLLVNGIATSGLLRRAAWVVVLIGGALGLVALADAATGYDRDFGGFAQAGTDPRPMNTLDVFADRATPRVGGPIGETNRFAQVLLMAVGIGVAFAGRETSQFLRRGGTAVTALAACGVVLTFSRGGAVALVFILGAALSMRAIRPRHLVVPLVALALVLGSVPEYRERLTSITQLRTATQRTVNEDEGDGSIRSRATENLAALNVFLDHPLLGVGPDLFPVYYQDYAERVGIRVKPGEREAHNLYLDVAAETGFLGLAALSGVIVTSLTGLRRARRSANAEISMVATGLILAFFGYLTAGVFLHFSFVRYFWLLAGLAGATAVLAAAEAGSDDREPGPQRPRDLQTNSSSAGSIA